MVQRLLSLCVALAVLGGCSCEEEAPPRPPAPPPRPPAPIVAGRAIAADAAFALVPVPEGALLAFAAPYREGGGVRVLRLGPHGETTETERPIATAGAARGGAAENHPSQAVEVDASSDGSRVGVAWVMDFGHHLSVQSAFSTDAGGRFGAVEDVAPTVRTESGERGRIAVAANGDGTIVLYHRIEEAECEADPGRACARFSRHGIGGDAARAGRGTEPLEVLHPCQPLVAGALSRGGTWYYGLCHVEGGLPSTTVYAIRPEVSYAGATPIPGCAPVSLAPLDDGVGVVTRCGSDVSITVLDEMGGDAPAIRPAERSAECREGRPVLRVREGAHEAKLQLGEAVDHLEGLLPDAIAPRGARAIWTGEALLVGVPRDRELTIRRYECVRGDRFDRTDVF